MYTKVCYRCKEEKPVSEFTKSSSAKDGLYTYCKVCKKIDCDNYRKNNQEKIKAYNYDYCRTEEFREKSAEIRATEESKSYAKEYASTPEYKAKKAEYRENNRDEIRANDRKYGASLRSTPEGKARLKASNDKYMSKPEVKEKWADHYAIRRSTDEYKEWSSEYRAKYQKTEKGIAVRRQANRNRRARKLNAVGSHTEKEVLEILHLQKCKCAICKKSLKKGYHIDHIIALSKGGSDYKENLQMLCPTCNLKKSTKDNLTFMQSKGYLI